MSNTNQNRFYIEQRPDGKYSSTRGGADRASFVEDTQAKAIDRTRESFPDAAIDVERVRDTDSGTRDKWRKP